ncbi:MAG: hypothetical protein CMH60_01190 [Myxococcales bacterium]|nr:hypothetical protein [Myxococcales bacterium]
MAENQSKLGKIYGWAFWSAILLLYLLSASRHPTYGDSGELLAASIKLAVPHPPGFPLYTFLAHLFYQILPGPDAWVVSALSAVCSLLCLQSCFRIVCLICGEARNTLLIYFSIGLLALSTVFWKFAVHVEVIALNTLLFALCTEFCIRTVQAKQENKFFYLLIAALFGSLGVANHHTIIFVLPQSLLALYVAWPCLNLKRWLYLIATCLSFVVVYLLFVLVSDPNEMISWRALREPYDLIHVFLRKDYGTFALTNFGGGERFPLSYFKFFLTTAWNNIHILVPAALVTFYFIKNQTSATQQILLALWLSLGLSSIGFFLLFNAPLQGYLAANNLKFFPLPETTLTILGACGLNYILQDLKQRNIRSLNPAFAALICLLILASTLFLRLPLLNAAEEKTLGNFCTDTLLPLPKNAIVLGGSDDVLFACGLYFIQTKSYRSDLHLMHAPPVEREMKRLQMLAKANYPMKRDTFLTLNMSRPWQFIMQLLDALPGAQIFLLDISLQPNKHYYELLQKYKFIPWGAAAEIVPIEKEIDLKALEKKNLQIYASYTNNVARAQALHEFFPNHYHHSMRIQAVLAKGWAELANLARMQEDYTMSFRALERALEIAPWISEFYFEAAKLQSIHPELPKEPLDYTKLLGYAESLTPDYSIYALPQSAFKEMVESKFKESPP